MKPIAASEHPSYPLPRAPCVCVCVRVPHVCVCVYICVRIRWARRRPWQAAQYSCQTPSLPTHHPQAEISQGECIRHPGQRFSSPTHTCVQALLQRRLHGVWCSITCPVCLSLCVHVCASERARVCVCLTVAVSCAHHGSGYCKRVCMCSCVCVCVCASFPPETGAAAVPQWITSTVTFSYVGPTVCVLCSRSRSQQTY